MEDGEDGAGKRNVAGGCLSSQTFKEQIWSPEWSSTYIGRRININC